MPTTRPARISELIAAAETAAPPGRDLKHYIRVAESHRRTGVAYMGRASSNANSAFHTFIEYACAATLIVETIPTHRDYQAGLSAEPETNLKARRTAKTSRPGKLKAALVERFERYAQRARVDCGRGPAA
ncbi:hypothetical protein B0H14DRAFT_3520151 [Mycena olivaceomarginata]|nr:hypothetical protein B0H14DRAFT_3520151 [Mycena olivaceomarginata]